MSTSKPSVDLPLSLDERLKPSDCALVIVDVQNDFCAPGGYIDKVMGMDISTSDSTAAAIQRLVDSARAANVPVVWVYADYSHDKIPDSMLVKLRQRGIDAVCCAPGSWGAEWFKLKPLDSETQVAKHTYSGFSGTDLAQKLKDLEVSTLVCTGVQTQICVESTVRDAHSLGYFCVVPEDAVGSHTPPLHEATLNNIRFIFGDVSNSEYISKHWSQAKA